MPTKISKVARELNVGVSTAVEFLRKNNVQVDDNPNARIDDMAVQLLFKEYSNDKDAKTHGQNQGRNNKSHKADKPAQQSAVRNNAPEVRGPKVVGKVTLDKKGNVVAPAPEKPKAPAAVADTPATSKPIEKPAVKPIAEKPAAPSPAPKPEAPKPAEKTSAVSDQPKQIGRAHV